FQIHHRQKIPRTFPRNFHEFSRERRKFQLRRECRGIVFSKETGTLLSRKVEKIHKCPKKNPKKILKNPKKFQYFSRRFHKFFNVNESPETREDKINFSEPHTIT